MFKILFIDFRKAPIYNGLFFCCKTTTAYYKLKHTHDKVCLVFQRCIPITVVHVYIKGIQVILRLTADLNDFSLKLPYEVSILSFRIADNHIIICY